MAENVDDIELKDLDRERQQVIEEEETSFIDGDRKPGDESISIFDGSNPVFTRVDVQGGDEGVRDRNLGQIMGDMERSETFKKKAYIKKWFEVIINKGDGPNSKLVYEQLNFYEKNGKVIGATYKGKKILFLKNGRLIYSTDKTKAPLVNEFKELLKKADAEHKKTPTPIAEKRAGVDLPQNIMDSIMENVMDRINIEVNRIAEEISSGTEIHKDELRELGGYVFDKGMIVDGVDLREETLKHFETIEIPFIKEKANEARAEGKERKAALYDAMKRAAELKADRIRLSLNEKPVSEEVVSMIEEETDANDLTRLEKFKKWARENVVGVSAIAISIAGIVTAAVIGARSVVKKGGKALGKFAKGVSKVFKKLGPLFSALGTFLSKMILLGSQGLLWLSQNLWVLFLIIASIVYNEYRRRKRR